MKKFIIIAVISFLITNNIYSQRCIVVRNISGFGQYNQTTAAVVPVILYRPDRE